MLDTRVVLSATVSKGEGGSFLGDNLIGVGEVVDVVDVTCLDLDTFPVALFVPPLASGEAPRDVGFLHGGISEGVGDNAIYWECAYVAGSADTTIVMIVIDGMGLQNKECDKERFFALGVADKWTKIPGIKGALQDKIAQMMLRKNWTECDKRRAQKQLVTQRTRCVTSGDTNNQLKIRWCDT